MHSRFTTLCAVVLVAALIGIAPAADKTADTAAAAAGAVSTIPTRPAVAGKVKLVCRSREEGKKGSGAFAAVEQGVEWNVAETAIIVCDMWNGHYCKSAAQRVDEMAPRMNSVLIAARSHGVAIIHAPSGTMDYYADTSYRRRVMQAPKAEPPVPLAPWCNVNAAKEPELPVDVSKCSCDDPVVGAPVRDFTRQHDAIKLIGYDGISDDGQEIYNYLTSLGIKNVVLMGVHTNMCVLGRPFGIRQLCNVGMNVVLARDLTDAMYDPREWPYVSHTRGTELVIEHIEQYWCPSIMGDDLTRVIPGSAGPDPEVARHRPTAVTAK